MAQESEGTITITVEEAREALWYKGAYEIEVARSAELEQKVAEVIVNATLVQDENARLEKQNRNIKRVANSLGLISAIELALILIGLALHFVPSP